MPICAISVVFYVNLACVPERRSTVDHLMTENAASLTTMQNGGLGYEAKYNYTDRLRKSEYHCHDFYEFYIHLRGGQYFGLDDNLYLLQPNQLFIVPPFSMHGLSCEDEMRGYERAYLNLSPELMKILGFEQIDLDQFFRSYTSRGQNTFQLSARDAEQCIAWVRQLEAGRSSDSALDNYGNYCILVNFLNVVCKTVHQSQAITGNVISNNIIQNVLTYINSHYTQPLKMDQLAKQFGISISYLSHEFTKFTNRSVSEYILYRRVMLAKQMIQTDLTLNTIAYQCGFNDYSNFLRMFNKLVGVSPSQYRKQLKPLQRIR